MPLDPEKIKHLIEVKNRPKKRGGGGRRKSGPDLTNLDSRNEETWFSLQHRMMNPETKELFHCENDECSDPRESGIMVVEVAGQMMCRYCFLDGWLVVSPGQEGLESA